MGADLSRGAPVQLVDEAVEPYGRCLGLTDDAVAVYRYAVANPHWTEEEAAESLGLDQFRLAGAVRALQSSRLLRRSIDPERRWDATGPDAALVDLLGEDELRVQRQQAALIRIREELLSLQPVYLEALRDRTPNEVIDVVQCSEASLPMLLIKYARHATDEVCVANTGDEARGLQWLHTFGSHATVRTPHSVRVMVGNAAVHNQLTRRRLALLNDDGCEVRTTQLVSIWLVLFDRSVAMLPAIGDRLDAGVAVVRSPAVVGALWSAFELLWELARPVPASPVMHTNGFRDRLRLDILEHLAAGHKDEVVARRVGLSVRTCRRHIADIMDQLGATSRFQAGVLAQRQMLGEDTGTTRLRPSVMLTG